MLLFFCYRTSVFSLRTSVFRFWLTVFRLEPVFLVLGQVLLV